MVLGSSFSGKSSIIDSFLNERESLNVKQGVIPSEQHPKMVKMSDKNYVKVKIWDTIGDD